MIISYEPCIAIVVGAASFHNEEAVFNILSTLPARSYIAYLPHSKFGHLITSLLPSFNFNTIAPKEKYLNNILSTYSFSSELLFSIYCNKYLIELVGKELLKNIRPIRCFAFHTDIKLGSTTKDMVIRCIKARVKTYIWLNKEIPETIRASHLVNCDVCKKDYINHPQLISELGYDGYPFLNWVCSGNVYHL